MAENSVIEVGRLVYAKGFTVSSLNDALTTAAPAAGASPVLFSLRNIGPEEVSIDRIDVEFFVSAPLGVAQRMEVGVFKTTNHTSQPAGGAAVTPLLKRVGDHAPIDPAEIAIARIDADGFTTQGSATINSSAPLIYLAADSSTIPRAAGLWLPEPGLIPHTLGPNEGIQARTFVDIPASSGFRLFIRIDARRA